MARRGGRPRLDQNDLRLRRSIYLSPREDNTLRLRAAEAGVPVPDFMRSALTSATIMSTSTISVDQWAALSTLSSNINQIAARLNSRPDDPVVSADRAVLSDLDDLLRDVRLRLLSVEPSS